MSLKDYKNSKVIEEETKILEETKVSLNEDEINELRAFVKGEPSVPAMIGLFFVSKNKINNVKEKYIKELRLFGFISEDSFVLTESGKDYLNSDSTKQKFQQFLENV